LKRTNPGLYIFGGLPATGKSTLATALARELSAVYLRADTIEQAMKDSKVTLTGPEGYMVAYAIAAENLGLGTAVVSDCVNPFEITREAWRNTAIEAGAWYVEIEVICSDPAEHRRRVESRGPDVYGLQLPDWQDIVHREYYEWTSKDLTIDTANRTPDESIVELFRLLNEKKGIEVL
jgi:predicted kinase